MMRILITGGSGDLSRVLTPILAQFGDEVYLLDIRPPTFEHGHFVQGSILDRELLLQNLSGIDLVIHIAAWHGVHDFRGWANVYDFWDLNVKGTFEVFEACAQSGVNKVIYMSSTSVDEPYGIYGHTKVLGEEIARAYHHRHDMEVLTLRPRAFIPHWNRQVYNSFVEWAAWYWGGAVHIKDVAQAVKLSVDLMDHNPPTDLHTLIIDGAYDFTSEEIANWDADGAGSTFAKRYPEYVDLVKHHGLDPAKKPEILDMSETKTVLGYEPRYSLTNLLEELATYGEQGPPAPETPA